MGGYWLWNKSEGNYTYHIEFIVLVGYEILLDTHMNNLLLY